MNKNWKAFLWTCVMTVFFMTLVLFWDYYALKANVFHWSYILVKGMTILTITVMGIHTFQTKTRNIWFDDVYAMLFYIYSFYGMAYIDMTYSYSFVECFFIVAFVVKQAPKHFLVTSILGLILSVAGFYMAKEPVFVAQGESYKPHAFTITFLLYAISVCGYFLINRYQMKVNQLNEKFALIGKQSSFLMHEIKNPLSRVVANSENSYSEQIMDDIRKDSQRISALVSSIETLIHHPEQLTRTFTVFDLADIKSTLIHEYGNYLKSMNINQEFDELQGQFYGNKHLIYQLIKNLILNAVEAIGYKKDEMSFIQIKMRKEGKIMHLSVINNNSHIPAKALEMVFEPHYTTKKTGSNKGLGLSLGKSIVEAHYGTIRAVSINQITSFEMRLPDYSTATAKI